MYDYRSYCNVMVNGGPFCCAIWHFLDCHGNCKLSVRWPVRTLPTSSGSRASPVTPCFYSRAAEYHVIGLVTLVGTSFSISHF